VKIGIKGSDTFIACHRVILAASSGYFRGLFASGFSEGDSQEIQIHAVDKSNVFRDVIHYLYSDDSRFVTQANALSTYCLASYLQIESLQKATEPFFVKMSKEACIAAVKFLHGRPCPVLPGSFLGCLTEHFHHLADGEDLVALPQFMLIGILTRPDLRIASELQFITFLKRLNDHNRFALDVKARINNVIRWEVLSPEEWEKVPWDAFIEPARRNAYIAKAREAWRKWQGCPRIWLAVESGHADSLRRYVSQPVTRFFDFNDGVITHPEKFKIAFSLTPDKSSAVLEVKDGGLWLDRVEFRFGGGSSDRHIQVTFYDIGQPQPSVITFIVDSSGIVPFQKRSLFKRVEIKATQSQLTSVNLAGFSFDFAP
jgi:hypothetical protein